MVTDNPYRPPRGETSVEQNQAYRRQYLRRCQELCSDVQRTARRWFIIKFVCFFAGLALIAVAGMYHRQLDPTLSHLFISIGTAVVCYGTLVGAMRRSLPVLKDVIDWQRVEAELEESEDDRAERGSSTAAEVGERG